MNRQNFEYPKSRAIFAVATLTFLAALVGIPLYLGLWQLAVYPAVIGGLVLLWEFFEYKARTDPNDALGFIDHVGGMFFSLFFVGPDMLFAVVWTIYPLAHIDPLVLGTAYTLAIFTVLLLVLGSNIEDFAIRFFFKYRPKNNQPRR